MDLGDVAALVAAGAFGVLVLFIARPLWKLGSLIGKVQNDVVLKQVVPLLGQTQTTVEHVNTNLANAETLTTNAADITTNARALATAFSATLGGPLVKAAAFSYAVRRAVSKRDKAEVDAQVRSARKAAKKTVKDRKSSA